MLTEDEARTKWCVHARLLVRIEVNGATIAATAVNHGEDGKGVPCIASACMAWRWAKKPVADEPIHGGINRGLDGHGFCGLAGPAPSNTEQ